MKASQTVRPLLILLLLSLTRSRLAGEQVDSAAGQAAGNGTARAGKSIEELKTKAEAGDAEAQNALGALYCEGKEVAQNYAEGVKWLQKAAEQKVQWAQYRLGRCYDFGRGVEEDHEQAFKWYRGQRNRGFPSLSSQLPTVTGRGTEYAAISMSA